MKAVSFQIGYCAKHWIVLGTIMVSLTVLGCAPQPAPEDDAGLSAEAEGVSPEEAVEAEAEQPEAQEASPQSAQAPEPQAAEAEPEAEPAEQPPEPDITLATPEEIAERVAEGQGKAVVVNFWATWCPPCIEEMPVFVKLYEQYEEDELLFVSVSADHKSTLEDRVEPYVEEEALPFPVLLVDGEPDAVAQALDIDFTGALPYTLVYSPDGELVKEWGEAITFDMLDGAVAPLLQG